MAMMVTLYNDDRVFEVQLTKLAKELLLQAAADMSPDKQLRIAPNPNIVMVLSGAANGSPQPSNLIELIGDWKPKDMGEDD
jgi:regulation of enolase protein 1 (concanavalin A-like superfamily)